MEYGISLSNQLNGYLQNLPFKSSFGFGSVKNDLLSCVSSIVYAGSIAVVYSESTFLKYGKEVSAMLNGGSFKVFDIVLKDSESVSVKTESLLSELPEDIRLIITFDYKFYPLIYYQATVRNIATLYVITDMNFKGILSSEIKILNGKSVDSFTVSCDRYFLFDISESKNIPASYLYALAIGEMPTLIDYKIFCYYKSHRFDKTAYTLLRDSIADAYKIFSYKTEERFAVLLGCLCKQEIAYSLDGEIYKCSAMRLAGKIYSVTERLTGGAMVETADRILGIYGLYFGGEYGDITEYPDYNSRADFLSKKMRIEEGVLLNGLINQIKAVSDSKEKREKLIKVLKPEVSMLLKSMDKAKNTYTALGGTSKVNNDALNSAIKYSGDFPDTVNGMSVVRESGISEFI